MFFFEFSLWEMGDDADANNTKKGVFFSYSFSILTAHCLQPCVLYCTEENININGIYELGGRGEKEANFETAEGRTITEIEDTGRSYRINADPADICLCTCTIQLNQAGTVFKAKLRNSNASK
jgi:hypothetical protein